MLTPPSARRNADTRSIFIGNVSSHMSEEQLISMFQPYGRILHVEIVRKPSMANGKSRSEAYEALLICIKHLA